jgi:streptogramin lyase
LTSTGASATLTSSWKGTLDGTLGSTTYSGKARFSPTVLSSSGAEVVTNGSGDVGLALPGSGNSGTATGSFASPASPQVTAYGSSTARSLTADCSTKRGLKALTVSGSITVVGNYTDPTIAEPLKVAAGPDGNLWFTNYANNSIGRITTAGAVSNFTGAGIDGPLGITAGPDGNLWFANSSNNSIGRITPGGVISNFTGTGIDDPYGITAGPDGNLWFTNYANNSIGRITTAGVVLNFTGAGIDGPLGITAGPDGNLWFANSSNNSIGSITTAGLVSNFSLADTTRDPDGITSGSDGNLWFTTLGNIPNQPPPGNGGDVGRITPAGVVSYFSNFSIDNPQKITEGPDGNLWVINAGNLQGADMVWALSSRRSDESPPPGRSLTSPTRVSKARAASRPGPTATCGSPAQTATQLGIYLRDDA